MTENEFNQGASMLNASVQAMSNSIGAANLDYGNKKFAAEQADKQRQWNTEMWQATNAYNYKMWQEANKYNSPEAQVQRLREAGLNPLFHRIG